MADNPFLSDAPAASSNPFLDASPAPTSAPAQKSASLADRFMHGARSTARTVYETSRLPVEALNAVLGAPQRFVEGAMMDESPRDFKGIYNAFHPNDPRIHEEALRATTGGKSTDPRFRGKVNNLVDDFAEQTVTDPLTYIPLLGEGNALRRGMNAGARAIGHKIPASVKNNVMPRPELNEAYTPQGRAIHEGIDESESSIAHHQADVDRALLAKHKKEIAKGVIPALVRQRLLQERYVHGTPKVREQALAEGYKPTVAEIATKPSGFFTKFREDYVPSQQVFEGESPLLKIGEEKTPKNEPRLGFEKPQTNKSDDAATLFARLDDRLASGRNAVRMLRTRKRTEEEIGLAVPGGEVPIPQQAFKDTKARAAANIKDQSKVFDVLNAGKKQVGRAPGLAALSDAQRDALFVNALPHIVGNVLPAAYLSGGLEGVLRGAKYAATGVPGPLRDEIEKYGVTSHFSKRDPAKFSPARLVPPVIRHASQAFLDRTETGLRAGRYEQLRKQKPDENPFLTAKQVRTDLGDYRNRPRYVELLRAIGANFPHYHNYIVPTTVGRAVLNNPERVERVARASSDLNSNLLPDAGYKINMGGLVPNAARMTTHFPQYVTSPSSIGPVLSSIVKQPSRPDDLQPLNPFIDYAKGLIPFAGVVGDAMDSSKYKSKAPGAMRAGLGLLGAFTTNNESAFERQVLDRMESTGDDRFKATQYVSKMHRRSSR